MKERKDLSERPFKVRYKDIRKTFVLGIIAGIVFITIGVSQMITNAVDSPSIFALVFGICFIFYTFILFFLYWKFNKYQENHQEIPKHLRIISGIFLVFSLAFNESSKENERYHLVFKEWRFQVLTWIFLNVSVTIIEFYAIHSGKTFWLLISFLIVSVICIISLILMFFIWKYQGTKSKLLVFLTIITLDYRNYAFYKKIIALNIKNQSDK